MDGPGGRRGGQGRGRGRCAGAASPRRSSSPASSSSSEEARCFEFIIRIDEDKLLPDKFIEFINGPEPAELQLQEARCGFCRWLVDVLFDRQGKMYLHTGWDKFARAHNLEVGRLVTFLYEGDNEMIVKVKVFDKTSYRRHYHTDESGEVTNN